jgi:ferredoxin
LIFEDEEHGRVLIFKLIYFKKREWGIGGKSVIINKDLCVGCGKCRPYCPVAAIMEREGLSQIDRDRCVECGTCERINICLSGAIIKEPDLPWPRVVRRRISDPSISSHSAKDGARGRGTSDLKSNDVNNRYKRGEAGFALEIGRPSVGVLLSEVEVIVAPIAKLEVQFVKNNPITVLMSDASKGALREDVRDERVLGATIEFVVDRSRIPEVIKAMEECSVLARNTVFSAGVITVLEEDGSVPNVEMLNEFGFHTSPNCKTNLGLGRVNTQESEAK